jgi:hypothetical protein
MSNLLKWMLKTKKLADIICYISPDVVIYLAALLASESSKNPKEAEEVIFNSVCNSIYILENNKKPYKFI